MDGIHGLNIGTGYTNLPAATKAEFNIQTILTDKINDAIPDILVAQIAGPGGTADVFKFVDASGNTVGNTVNVIFNNAATAPLLSMYGQDQYLVQNTPTLTASTSKPYNNSNWNSNNAAGTGNGQMRMVAFKLSEFGITASNYTQIKKFVTLPSGSTDLAFVAYSNGSMNVPPSLGVNETTTSSVICSAANSTSNAFLSVRPYSSSGGSLSYYCHQMEEQIGLQLPIMQHTAVLLRLILASLVLQQVISIDVLLQNQEQVIVRNLRSSQLLQQREQHWGEL
jgi:hypothetical protein